MNPSERRNWLLAHNGPPGMYLVTEGELTKLNLALHNENRAKRTLLGIVERTSTALGLRLTVSQGVVEEAVAEAVFDADRFKFLADQSERIVNECITNCQTIINGVELNTWQEDMLNNLANDLGKLLVVLRTQREKKRDPKPIDPARS